MTANVIGREDQPADALEAIQHRTENALDAASYYGAVPVFFNFFGTRIWHGREVALTGSPLWSRFLPPGAGDISSSHFLQIRTPILKLIRHYNPELVITHCFGQGDIEHHSAVHAVHRAWRDAKGGGARLGQLWFQAGDDRGMISEPSFRRFFEPTRISVDVTDYVDKMFEASGFHRHNDYEKRKRRARCRARASIPSDAGRVTSSTSSWWRTPRIRRRNCSRSPTVLSPLLSPTGRRNNRRSSWRSARTAMTSKFRSAGPSPASFDRAGKAFTSSLRTTRRDVRLRNSSPPDSELRRRTRCARAAADLSERCAGDHSDPPGGRTLGRRAPGRGASFPRPARSDHPDRASKRLHGGRGLGAVMRPATA